MKALVFSKGALIILLLALVWALLPSVAPYQVEKISQVGGCVSTTNQLLKIKELNLQADSSTTIVVEEISTTKRMLVVLLEGTGESIAGMFYFNWNGVLHVLSFQKIHYC